MEAPSPSSALMTGQPPLAMQEPLVPTVNFAMVCPGVYRSGYPTRKNHRFLRALRLRSIVYLCPEEYAESNVKFCEESSIAIFRFPTEGNKEPFMDISEPLMHRILSTLVDTRTHPVLIHCNKGKHRTGTVVACLRLLQGWSLVSIFQEYRTFAGDKVRMGDQQYVELYRPIVCATPPHVAEWVCLTRHITVVRSEQELREAEARQLKWSLLAPPQEQQQKQPPPLPLPHEEQQQECQGQQQKQQPQSARKKEAACHFVEEVKQQHVDSEAAIPPKLSAATAAPCCLDGHDELGGSCIPANVKNAAVAAKNEAGEEGMRPKVLFLDDGVKKQHQQ